MSNYSSNSSSDDKVIMTMINLSVLMLGTLGIILNGFSLHVLWKCMTTGQLGIKLVLLSDLVVCLAYVISNIQNNIANSITSDFFRIRQLVAINRLSIHISLFVSNWWIIALLVLRILTIFSPKNINSWNKMLYHKLVYGLCWISAIAIIVPLRFHEQYTRLIICVVPVALVSLEAGLIIYGIRRVKPPKLTPNIKTLKSSYQEVPCSSSTSSTYIKVNPVNVQPSSKCMKPYNNIVLTILTLALNYLILDCLQFIDALHTVCAISKDPLPTWFMLLINIFSLLKRIFNFVILCAKCRYFRKIMNLKINLISRHFHRHQNLKKRNLSNHALQKLNDPWKGYSHCTDCQKPVLFVKENELLSESNLIGRLLETAPFPMKGLSNKNDLKKDHCINSYYSAFEVLPFMSQISHQSNNQVYSTKY